MEKELSFNQIPENQSGDWKEKILTASPEKLKMLKETLKSGATWAGIFTTVFGAYISYKAFGDRDTVKNIIDSGVTNAEEISKILTALKVVGGGITTLGILEILGGYTTAQIRMKIESEQE